MPEPRLEAGLFGMRFAYIPPSLFPMGSPDTEIGRDIDEVQHIVRLTQGYYLQTTPVTNAQFRQWKAHDSGSINGVSLNADQQPVVSVSWHDAQAYAAWLSAQDQDASYRLPTEAEWECGARAGTATRYWWGEDACRIAEFANIADRTCMHALQVPADGFDLDDGYPASSTVGAFKPNPFGLFDMLGNVWEFCGNWAYQYPAAGSVLVDPKGPPAGALVAAKGGDYLAIFAFVRVSNRAFNRPDDAVNSLGFRLVRQPKNAGPPPTNYDPCQAAVPGKGPTWAMEIAPLLAGAVGVVNQVQLTQQASVVPNACKVYSAMRDDRLLAAGGRPWAIDDLALMYEWLLKGCI